MHGTRENATRCGHMAKDGASTCQSASIGLAQCPDASAPMVASGAQHGKRMANPPQPPASQRQRASGPTTDMAGVRPSGRRHPGQQETPCREERLASMGPVSRDRRQSLHPQEQAPMVEPVKPQGSVSIENVLRLLEHQQYRCALTGRNLTPETAALDHIVPIRVGGDHLIENTQALHKDVNRAKGSLTSDEFIGLCREVTQQSGVPVNRKDVQ